MRPMKSESSVLPRAIHGADHKLLRESTHCVRSGLQAHVGRSLPGEMPGYFNAAA